jgi:DNA-directed RNA polymerase alpha subunit
MTIDELRAYGHDGDNPHQHWSRTCRLLDVQEELIRRLTTTAEPTPAKKRPIEEEYLLSRWCRKLSLHGFTYMEDFEYVSIDDITRIRGIGKCAVRDITRALKPHGLSWAAKKQPSKDTNA